MSHTVVDVGWVAPLFYTAVKCRVHRVRMQAVRLLELTSHREGIWDSKIAALVSRKVVALEEGDYYAAAADAAAGATRDDSFAPCSRPTPADLARLPPLPESRRIRGLEVVLVGGPVDRVVLLCRPKRQPGATDAKARIAEYDVALQRWLDVDDGML